jgi:hypothetical protein
MTTATGKSLNSLELLKSDRSALCSAVVAGNADLGNQILRYLDKGFAKADSLSF